MKALRALLCVVVRIVGFGPSLSRSEVDFEFFYDELSPYGAWVEVEDYGYCFRPWVDEGWRPYTDGYWADSDEGWVWVSNEPFGWLTYHYGRWAHTDLGWIWVPGYEWAPAWVSWRESEQYIGWAPLPPEVPWRPSTGIRFGISFGFGDVGPAYYNFCRPRYFGYPRLRDYLVPVQQNVNIIEQTTNITNITNVVNNNRTVIYNAGPNREFVRARSERPVRRLAIERTGENLSAAELRQRKLRNEVQGDRLRVVSPKVAKKDVTKPKKIAGRVEKRQIDDGYVRVADPQRAEAVRRQIRQQAENPKDQRRAVVGGQEREPGQEKRNEGVSARNVAGAGKPQQTKPEREAVLRKQREFETRQSGGAAKKNAVVERPEGKGGQTSNGPGRKDVKSPNGPAKQDVRKPQRERQPAQLGRQQQEASRQQRQKQGGEVPRPQQKPNPQRPQQQAPPPQSPKVQQPSQSPQPPQQQRQGQPRKPVQPPQGGGDGEKKARERKN